MSDERGHAVRWQGDEFECSCGISWSGWGASFVDHLRRHPARELPPPNGNCVIYFHGRNGVWQTGIRVAGKWVKPPPVPERFQDHPHNNTQGEHG